MLQLDFCVRKPLDEKNQQGMAALSAGLERFNIGQVNDKRILKHRS